MKNKAILNLIFCSFLYISCNQLSGHEQEPPLALTTIEVEEIRQTSYLKVKKKSKEAQLYCQAKHLNTDFFILVDLSIHSGLKRFFIWDIEKDTAIYTCLVSHGCNNFPWGQDHSKSKAIVSNVNNSHASSIGKYIIGNRGQSAWGIGVNYLLHGQDSTNSNALKRQIVLHSWEEVADEEVYPKGTPEGWGCPAISNKSMKLVDEKLTLSEKPVLLWVIQ